MSSKLSFCFLVVFALFSFVSADDWWTPIPPSDPVLQEMAKLLNFRYYKILKEAKFIRIRHLWDNVTFKVANLHILKSQFDKQIYVCKIHFRYIQKINDVERKTIDCKKHKK